MPMQSAQVPPFGHLPVIDIVPICGGLFSPEQPMAQEISPARITLL